jgi:DNA-binding MarR family transcriptional regulator
MPLAALAPSIAPAPPVPSGPTSPQPAAPGAAESAFRSLNRTLGLLRRATEPYFSNFGISSSQWSVLRTLQRAEEDGQTAPRLTDLCDRLVVRPASITGVVDRLQRTGLVSRTASADDHRAKHVTLTPQGRDLVRRVLEHHPAHIRCVLDGLSAPEQGELQRLLERLASHLQRIADGRDHGGAKEIRP